MPNQIVDSERESGPDFVTAAATIGVIAAGVALFEVALIPGMVIGGAAVLAPRYFPNLRRRLQPLFGGTTRGRGPAPARPDAAAPLNIPARLAIKQAVAKTITYRIIVTTLDFTSNYVVIGEFATAAGLSAFALVAGPLFYFTHEAAWNYFGPAAGKAGAARPAIDLTFLLPGRSDATAPAGRSGFTISRALAKTITFRTIATTIDFTTTYVVVGEFATAAALSAFGFVVGPFVYLGHEMAWDRYGWAQEPVIDLTPTNLVPAPV